MSTLARPVSANTPKPLALTTSDQPRPSSRSPWLLAWRRLRRNQLAVMGALIVLIFGGLALGADSLAPYGFNQFDFLHVEDDPSAAHFLGTDFDGRDVLTLIMYGARISFSVAMAVPLIIVLIGVPLGLIAGYVGGWVDSLLMRITDVMFAFPAFLFMVLLITTFGRGLGIIFLALGISSWPLMARVVRAQVMQLKENDYLLSARSIGTRPIGILVWHVLPNLAGSIVSTATLSIPGAIIAEAFLTYLNIGVEPATPSWGMMISDARESIFWHPTLILFPSLAITVLSLAFTFVGDGLRDALDPRQET